MMVPLRGGVLSPPLHQICYYFDRKKRKSSEDDGTTETALVVVVLGAHSFDILCPHGRQKLLRVALLSSFVCGRLARSSFALYDGLL